MNITMRHAAASIAAIGVTGGLAACGGDNDKTTPAAPAPESVIAPDVQVTAGLKRLVVIAERVAGSDRAAVKQLEPVWMRIEGTVKRNEPDMYLSVEDSLALLNKSDAVKTKDGARLMARTVLTYLAKHPG
jgi:hypothetical protein